MTGARGCSAQWQSPGILPGRAASHRVGATGPRAETGVRAGSVGREVAKAELSLRFRAPQGRNGDLGWLGGSGGSKGRIKSSVQSPGGVYE